MEKTNSLLENGTYTISFLSSTEYLDEVEAVTVKISNELKFDSSSADDLSISVTEMFNNAVEHGNKNDPNKTVTLTYTRTESHLIISIRDEGSGFAPEKIKDPLAPENLLAENGRGIYLVKNLMDNMIFNISELGTEILLYKKLPGKNAI